jgi:nitrilase
MRIAAAQTSPAWLDRAATTATVLDWLGRAADARVELLAFPEAFLSGYPFWVCRTDGARFDDPRHNRAYADYLDAAVELDGRELARIVEAARDLRVFTYLGVTERGVGTARGTVFCTLVAIDPRRGVVGAHRKLMPTHDERLVWGAGDGHGLRVHPCAGLRVGGLSCWENWMPQARLALYAGGEDLHVSVWPGSCRLTAQITRFIALEGRVYSLAAGGLLAMDDVPADFPFHDQLTALSDDRSFDGGSAVAGPDGSWLVEPVSGVEQLVVAEIDVARVRAARHHFDPTGHYGRPDVFELRVDRRRHTVARFDDEP